MVYDIFDILFLFCKFTVYCLYVSRDTVWGVLTGQCSDNIPSLVMHEVREIETWILRLLSAPVPVPTKTRVEVNHLSFEIFEQWIYIVPSSFNNSF